MLLPVIRTVVLFGYADRALAHQRTWTVPGHVGAHYTQALRHRYASLVAQLFGVPQGGVGPGGVGMEAVILVEQHTLRALEDAVARRNQLYCVLVAYDLGYLG